MIDLYNCNPYHYYLCFVMIYLALPYQIDSNDLYIYTACVAQLAKASDTQPVGHRFKPHPDH